MRNEKGLIGWIILLILAGIATVAILLAKNIPNSLPGDFIYPIKEANENWRVEQDIFSFADRANTYLDITQERLTEIEELIKRGNKDREIMATIQRLLDVQGKAISNADRARNQSLNRSVDYAKLRSILQKEQNDLPVLILSASQLVADGLQKIIDRSYTDSQILDSIK